MPKVKVTKFGNTHSIHKFADREGDKSMPVMVSDAGITANSEGRKIVPAGTLVGGGVLKDSSKSQVSPVNDATTEGVLTSDIDVTDGPASADMLVHGIVNLSRIPTAPTAAAETALKMILFIA